MEIGQLQRRAALAIQPSLPLPPCRICYIATPAIFRLSKTTFPPILNVSANCYHALILFHGNGAGLLQAAPHFIPFAHRGLRFSSKLVRRLSMIIKCCSPCGFHQIKQLEKERISYCQKENCWSKFSRCIRNKTLNRFLEQESTSPSAVVKT